MHDAPKIDFSMVIASAVHDMKNSLGMVLHSLDELRESMPEEVRQTRRFNTLQYEAERVHGDLVQLLGLYRLQEETLAVNIDEHYLGDVLEEQMARHRPLLDGLDLTGGTLGSDIIGYFDRDLIGGVLANIMNNAIRYTKSRIQLEAREEDGYLVLSVADDGQGYPAHMRDAPELVHKGIDFSSGSTGLGLYFAASVAHLHHQGERTGFIRLRNGGELGGGIFELWLP